MVRSSTRCGAWPDRIHASEVERRLAHVADASTTDGAAVIADTREQVAALNAAIRDRLACRGARRGRPTRASPHAPASGSASGTGSRPGATTATSAWPTATPGPSPHSADDGSLRVAGDALATGTCPRRLRRASTSSSPTPPPSTAPRARPPAPAHLLLGEHTGAASAYVAHDPRPATATSPTWSPTASTTPDASGIECSAATAPTSDPPRRPTARRGHRPLRSRRLGQPTTGRRATETRPARTGPAAPRGVPVTPRVPVRHRDLTGHRRIVDPCRLAWGARRCPAAEGTDRNKSVTTVSDLS